MKAISILMFITLSLSANHVRWFSNYEYAHKEALRQNKQLMILLIKKECFECKETLQKTFMNRPYIDEINKKFISVIVSKDQIDSYPIEMLYTLTYPTLFFLDKYELYSCDPIRGQITPDVLKNHLLRCK